MVGQEQQATVEQTPTNCLLDQKTLENAILAQAYAHKQASKEQTMILQATHLTVLGRVSPKNQEIIDESKPSDQLLFLDEDDLWAPAYKVQKFQQNVHTLLRTHHLLYLSAENSQIRAMREELAAGKSYDGTVQPVRFNEVTTSKYSDEAVQLILTETESVVGRPTPPSTKPPNQEESKGILLRLRNKAKGAETEYTSCTLSNNICALVTGNAAIDANTQSKLQYSAIDAKVALGWALIEFGARFGEETLGEFIVAHDIMNYEQDVSLAQQRYLEKP